MELSDDNFICFEVIPETVSQYTGLKDKNGVEIYEGDKFKDVLNSSKIGIVKFGEYVNCFDRREIEFGGHFGFFVDFFGENIRKDLSYWTKNSEVVGNIYKSQAVVG
jgi:uncharacterized phage protein (TIGR01671 family)